LLALIGGVVAAVFLAKAKGARNAAAMNKPVGRATAISQAPQDSLLQSRLQTRNLRSLRLAPLNTQTSQLPPSSVGSMVPTTIGTNPSTATFKKPNLGTSARGIPIRLDSVRY
jgi:hypothetical protein